jgi:hypothetical protein
MLVRSLACLVSLALAGAPAAARHFYQLPVTATACFDLDDARRLKDPLNEAGGPSCRRLSPSRFFVDRSVTGFACLHISRGDCAWVPAAILKSTILDDGVF